MSGTQGESGEEATIFRCRAHSADPLVVVPLIWPTDSAFARARRSIEMDLLMLWSHTLPDCIQCAAEIILAADPADIDEDLRKGLEKSHGGKLGQTVASLREMSPQLADSIVGGLHAIGSSPIEPRDMDQAMRTVRRMTRFTARIILLEPHECGQQ